MPTEQATKRTHCPNCGAKLPEQPLSLCAYCAMPLGLDRPETAPGGTSPHAARIAKIEEHESWPEIRDSLPPESPLYYRARADAFRGRWLMALGAAVLAIGGLASTASPSTRRSATGTVSPRTPAARWWRSAATTST